MKIVKGIANGVESVLSRKEKKHTNLLPTCLVSGTEGQNLLAYVQQWTVS